MNRRDPTFIESLRVIASGGVNAYGGVNASGVKSKIIVGGKQK